MKKWTRKRWFIIAWLTIKLSIFLPTNVFTGETLPSKTGFQNIALAPRPIAQKPAIQFQWNPNEKKFTQADAAFFRMLNAIAGEEPGSIVVLPTDYNFHTLKYAMEFTKPGGFLLLEIGEWLGFKLLLQMEGWEQLPMLWGNASIYRKPHRMNGASA